MLYEPSAKGRLLNLCSKIFTALTIVAFKKCLLLLIPLFHSFAHLVRAQQHLKKICSQISFSYSRGMVFVVIFVLLFKQMHLWK